MRKAGLALALLAGIFTAACTVHGRLYNLTTGEVTPVTVTYNGASPGRLTTGEGKGRIQAAVKSSGESITGEYTTFAHKPVNWGSTYAKVYGTEGSAFTSSEGKSNRYGTAVATGDKGTILDCEYVVTPFAHGAGACVDNRGTLYKLMF